MPQIGPTDLSFPQEEIQIIMWQELPGKTPAYISLRMHILCGDPRKAPVAPQDAQLYQVML